MDYPDNYEEMTSIEKIEFHFPLLKGGTGYRNTSPESMDYNCLAWALGIAWAHYNPTQHCPGYYWFPGVRRIWNCDTITEIFEKHGYQRCDSYELEEGFEKVVFYVDADGKPTHFARQLENGKWTSKLGNLNDIEHDDLAALSGETGYHNIERVLWRPRHRKA